MFLSLIYYFNCIEQEFISIRVIQKTSKKCPNFELNLYLRKLTLFTLDAISENVLIFYDYNLKSFNTRIKYRKMIPIDFNSPEKSLNLIFLNLNNKKILGKKNYFKKINFDKYFDKWI